eukprot:CAMPEP_0117423150 /NCGR_PEP_ID=MMETSP0758-20121206/3839_1 /TAXON_ID=63605 /ORGANISM="Percolomonas cosmopolitus, Strain AE-1 (ATCC 50343)" /LENGTH=231 /DNA_ID=CAMNT_0005206181 /DNA_START=228 /DNA_END=924 /DNA_ORIENTATION=-
MMALSQESNEENLNEQLPYLRLTKLEENKIKSIQSDGTYIATVDGKQVRVKLMDENQPLYAKEWPKTIQHMNINDGLLAVVSDGVIIVVDLKSRKTIFAFKHEKGPMMIMGIHVSSDYVAIILSSQEIEMYPIQYNGIKTTNKESKYYIYRKHDSSDFVMVGDDSDGDVEEEELQEEKIESDITERVSWNHKEYRYTTKHFDSIEEHEDAIATVMTTAKLVILAKYFLYPN